MIFAERSPIDRLAIWAKWNIGIALLLTAIAGKSVVPRADNGPAVMLLQIGNMDAVSGRRCDRDWLGLEGPHDEAIDLHLWCSTASGAAIPAPAT